MKRRLWLVGLLSLCCALLSPLALADGLGEDCWSAVFNDEIALASYARDYNKYASVDGCGGATLLDTIQVTVVSKSASVWKEPRTNSNRIASVKNGETLRCHGAESVDGIRKENGFYAVEYNNRDGWINEDYVVRSTLEIVLMESNVPAYIAPTTAAKKVGSLAKGTRCRVIGFYDDYYIVLLRDAAAAFIPMSVKHYDTCFEAMYRQAAEYNGVTNGKTDMRTGPGKEYPVQETVKAGYAFKCIDKLDGWYMLRCEGSSTDGELFAFIGQDAAEVWGL